MTVWFRSLQNIQKRKKILKTLDARSKKPRGGRLTFTQSLLIKKFTNRLVVLDLFGTCSLRKSKFQEQKSSGSVPNSCFKFENTLKNVVFLVCFRAQNSEKSSRF